MARRCNDNPTIGGVKGRAYAVTGDGALVRLTRAQLISGALPAGTERVRVVPPSEPAAAREFAPQVASLLTAGTAQATRRLRRTATSATVEVAPNPASGRPRELEFRVLEVTQPDGSVRRVAFGVPDDLADFVREAHPDVELLARNPFALAGISPTDPSAPTLATDYAHAVAALHNTQPCRICGWDLSCRLCQTLPETELRRATKQLVGRVENSIDLHKGLYVDALLVAASSGDEKAARELAALSQLGRQMVDLRRPARQRFVPPPAARAALALPDAEFDAWVQEQEDLLEKRRSAAAALSSDIEQASGTGLDGSVFADGRDLQAARVVVAAEEAAIGDAFRELASLSDIRREGFASLSIDDLVLVHETPYPIVFDDEGNIVLHPAEDHEPLTYRMSIHTSIGHRAAPVALAREYLSEGRAIVVPFREVVERNHGTVANSYGVDTVLVTKPSVPAVFGKDKAAIVEYDPAPDVYDVAAKNLSTIPRLRDAPAAQLREIYDTVAASLPGATASLPPREVAERVFGAVFSSSMTTSEDAETATWLFQAVLDAQAHVRAADRARDVAVNQAIEDFGGTLFEGGPFKLTSKGAQAAIRLIADELGVPSEMHSSLPHEFLEDRLREAHMFATVDPKTIPAIETAANVAFLSRMTPAFLARLFADRSFSGVDVQEKLDPVVQQYG